jgi:hypothetical protein
MYKGNITLYALGAVFRSLNKGNVVFYDGCICWNYKEIQDISTTILQVWDKLRPRRIKGKLKFLDRRESLVEIFIDDTELKNRMEWLFDIEPSYDMRLSTLGMTQAMISKWISENLRYPIAFLDDTLHRFLREDCVNGDKLRQYDAYFTNDKCAWLKSRLTYADEMARVVILEKVGYDPDTRKHGMSGLQKGHYAPVLFSVEGYIEEMNRKLLCVL